MIGKGWVSALKKTSGIPCQNRPANRKKEIEKKPDHLNK